MNNYSPHNRNFSNGTSEEDFLKMLVERTEANLQSEQFCVGELARQMHISRSQLHRKLKQITHKSANQFIREYKLKRALHLICDENKTISEAAFEVGFGSVSYFTSCFTAFFDHSPGEVRRNHNLKPNQKLTGKKLLVNPLPKNPLLVIFIGSLILLNILSVVLLKRKTNVNSKSNNSAVVYEKHSIAVLPFTNLNTDIEYEYFSRGVVEAISRQMSKMEMLNVVSLTTAASYKKSNKSVVEIGNGILVSYLLEGSFQHWGNRIRLEVRLIDTNNDLQVWAECYERELNDVFKIQTEIAEQVTQALNKIFSSEDKNFLEASGTNSIDA